MVAPHYLAAEAGVQMLVAGGNAVDAAIAANAVLGVVWPHMCGVGGDLFMLIHEPATGRVHGLNASGRAPAAMTRRAFAERGLDSIPFRGPLPITVPGAVAGWAEALSRFGRLGLERVLQPAIHYAEAGFPVSERLARAIDELSFDLRADVAAAPIYLPRGRAPAPGDRLVQHHLAGTLRRIAAEGPDVFYRGPIGEAIADAVQRRGGLLAAEDLAAHRVDWVDPIRTTYRGWEVLEMPPNTQGAVVLQMLNLLEQFHLAELGHNSAEAIHLQVEAKRLAFADRAAYLTDPDHMPVPVERLIDKRYAAQRRGLIDREHAMPPPPPGPRPTGDTVYLCAADRDGWAVSLIQSLYLAFGSTVVADGTGIVLQNRGAFFSLDPHHVNRLEPGKRTLHTLIPAMALRHGQPELIFGTRGADGQPQFQVQIFCNVVDFGMDPQAAVSAARWIHGGWTRAESFAGLLVEDRIPGSVRSRLERLGHQIRITGSYDDGMGTTQMIQIDRARGALVGGADPRGDSAAIGY